MNENSTAIQTHTLTRRYGDLTAVDRLDLTVPKGELVREGGLLGFEDASREGVEQILEEALALLLPLFSIYASAAESTKGAESEGDGAKPKQLADHLPDEAIEPVDEREAVVVEGQRLRAVEGGGEG